MPLFTRSILDIIFYKTSLTVLWGEMALPQKHIEVRSFYKKYTATFQLPSMSSFVYKTDSAFISFIWMKKTIMRPPMGVFWRWEIRVKFWEIWEN